MPFALPVRPAVVLLAGALLLTGCDGSSGAEAYRPAGGASAGHPVGPDDCGQKGRVEAPPQRAVSLDQGTTEIMLSLGLADRMAGTANWTDPVPRGLEKANATVERLADNAPSLEKVMATKPDFVAASFASTLGKGGVATREQFGKLGVPTYVAPSDCVDRGNSGDGSRTKPLTMEAVYGEVTDLATIFGVEERGRKLVAELKTRLAAASAGMDVGDVRLVYWFANSQSPYIAGCCGAPNVVTREVGASNAFADTHEEWPQVDWKTVADRDPSVLVIGDLSRKHETAETAEGKIEFLESDPVTRNMDAVKSKHYVLLSEQAMTPSIRMVEGVEKVAEALRHFHYAG